MESVFRNRSQEAYDKSLEHKLYRVIQEGEFQNEQVKFDFVEPGSSLQRTPEMIQYIDDIWQGLITSGLRPWPNDTKATRYRVVSSEIRDGVLHVVLDPCLSYKDIICSGTKKFRERFPQENANVHALFQDACIIAVDDDGTEKILLSIRSQDVDFLPGGAHVSAGGGVEMAKDKEPTDGILREVKEEIGIEKSSIDEITCLGIHTFETHGPIYSMPFIIKTNLSPKEIKAKENDQEMSNFIWVPTDSKSIQQCILAFTHAHTPLGIASLLAYGRKKFGKNWLTEMEVALAWRTNGEFDYTQPGKREELMRRDTERLKNYIDSMKVKSA